VVRLFVSDVELIDPHHNQATLSSHVEIEQSSSPMAVVICPVDASSPGWYVKNYYVP
jgi:hypothetical protein